MEWVNRPDPEVECSIEVEPRRTAIPKCPALSSKSMTIGEGLTIQNEKKHFLKNWKTVEGKEIKTQGRQQDKNGSKTAELMWKI